MFFYVLVCLGADSRLRDFGFEPGYFIGGQSLDFSFPARLGKEGAPFVIEGDEYDTAFFDKVPKDLEDAARIDGCSKLGIWWNVALPLARPALAVIIIFFCFVGVKPNTFIFFQLL